MTSSAACLSAFQAVGVCVQQSLCPAPVCTPNTTGIDTTTYTNINTATYTNASTGTNTNINTATFTNHNTATFTSVTTATGGCAAAIQCCTSLGALGGTATAQVQQATMESLGGGAFPLTQEGCATLATEGDVSCNSILGLWQGGWGLCK
jgi:hypothetical protein